MESASESLKYLAPKVLGKVLRYAGSSACRVEQRRHSRQFSAHPFHRDSSIEAVGE
jgi:hypothetical protein